MAADRRTAAAVAVEEWVVVEHHSLGRTAGESGLEALHTVRCAAVELLCLEMELVTV